MRRSEVTRRVFVANAPRTPRPRRNLMASTTVARETIVTCMLLMLMRRRPLSRMITPPPRPRRPRRTSCKKNLWKIFLETWRKWFGMFCASFVIYEIQKFLKMSVIVKFIIAWPLKETHPTMCEISSTNSQSCNLHNEKTIHATQSSDNQSATSPR